MKDPDIKRATSSPPPSRTIPATPQQQSPEELHEITMEEAGQGQHSSLVSVGDVIPDVELPSHEKFPPFYSGKIDGKVTYFQILNIFDGSARYCQTPSQRPFVIYDQARLEEMGFAAINHDDKKRIEEAELAIKSYQDQSEQTTNISPPITFYKAPGDNKAHPFYQTIEKLAELINKVDCDEKYSKSHKEHLRNQFERLTYTVRRPLFKEAKDISQRIGSNLGFIDSAGNLNKIAFDNKSKGLAYRSQVKSYKNANGICDALFPSLVSGSSVNPVKNAVAENNYENYIVGLYYKIQDRIEKLNQEKLSLGIDKNLGTKAKIRKGVIDNFNYPFEENLLKIISDGLTPAEKEQILANQEKQTKSHYVYPSKLAARKYEDSKMRFNPVSQVVSDPQPGDIGSGQLAPEQTSSPASEAEETEVVETALQGQDLSNSRTVHVEEKKVGSCFSSLTSCFKPMVPTSKDQGDKDKQDNPPEGKKDEPSLNVSDKGSQPAPVPLKSAAPSGERRSLEAPVVIAQDDDPKEAASRTPSERSSNKRSVEPSPLGGAADPGAPISRMTSVDSSHGPIEVSFERTDKSSPDDPGQKRGRKRGEASKSNISSEDLNRDAELKAAKDQKGIEISNQSPRGGPRTPLGSPPVESPKKGPAGSPRPASVEITGQEAAASNVLY